MLTIAWFLIQRFFPSEIREVSQAETLLKKRVQELGPVTRIEK